MGIQEIISKFFEKDYLIGMGAGSLSKMLECSREDIYEARKIYYEKLESQEVESTSTTITKPTLPKILVLDIETSPMKGYIWNRWKQNIHLEQTISEWFMLTWSAKWLFDPKMYSARLNATEVLNEDDSRIVKQLWNLLEEADMVIAHNGDVFDIPKINSRFILNGLGPTSPYQQIDTKKIAAKQFGFSSNKLDALAGYFGIRHKDKTDFELWARCMKGDEDALKYMEHYNNGDVVILEEVYLKLRPWIKSHPNVGLYVESDKPICAHCGSEHLTILTKPYYTSTGKYNSFRCECGAINRVRFSSLNKDTKKSLLISTNS